MHEKNTENTDTQTQTQTQTGEGRKPFVPSCSHRHQRPPQRRWNADKVRVGLVHLRHCMSHRNVARQQHKFHRTRVRPRERTLAELAVLFLA